MQASIAPPQTATYDTDFVAWTHQQAALLRQGRLGSLDIQNIAEEIEEIGKGVRREFLSRTVILITHLLKWQFQPDYRGRGWENTIRTQRRELDELIHDNPSLISCVTDEWYSHAWRRAVENASYETGIPERDFPNAPTWDFDTIITPSFMPADGISSADSEPQQPPPSFPRMGM